MSEQFVRDLHYAYTQTNPVPLNSAYYRELLCVLTEIYIEKKPDYQKYLRTCLEALTILTNQIDEQYLGDDLPQDALFSVPLEAVTYNQIADHRKTPAREWHTLSPSVSAGLRAFVQPFRENFPCRDGHFSSSHPSSDDYGSDAQYRAAEREYKKDRQEWYDLLFEEDLICLGTWLFKYANRLIPPLVQAPFNIPDENRFQGHWIIAPPGKGKTTLLHHMLQHDLELVANGKASIILMDSKGDLINDVPKLKMFAPGQPLHNKIAVLEPHETYPLALNPLDIKGSRSQHTVAFLEYIFSALLESKLTSLQATLFRSILSLLMQMPEPTLATFRDMVVNGFQPYEKYIKKLDKEAQDFFIKEFDNKPKGMYFETRQQIAWRLRHMRSNPILRVMFDSLVTKVDIGSMMDSGMVVVINNNKGLLEEEGAEFFGRFFIALVLSAAQRRSNRPDHQKMPVYFYIDECQNVIKRDEKIATILDECRSQKIALILAHQRLNQIHSSNVLSALANCGIRFANSDDDAMQLANHFRLKAEALRDHPKGTFVAMVRDKTKTGIPLQIPNRPLSALPKMTEHEYASLQERMRDLYCQSPPRNPEQEPELAVTAQTDPIEPSGDWK